MIKKEILSQIIVMLLSLLWVNALLSGSIGNLPDRRSLSGHKKEADSPDYLVELSTFRLQA